MFGQHDDSAKHDDTVKPDDTTAQEPVNTAVPPSDVTLAPANDGMLPAPAADKSAEPNFIATDQNGQPDLDDTPSLPKSADALLDIKKDALQQLSPLVGHLNQSPEEKFRTTMMMIQASDDQSLIPDAYAAAKEITDDKTRAQALLDIINEINYFTQQHAA